MKTEFKITKTKIDYAKQIIENKAKVWKRVFPNLEFDEFGRANVGLMPAFKESEFRRYIKNNMSQIFNECWIQVFEERRLKQVPLSSVKYHNFVTRRLEVETLTGYKQERSLTSLLARAHEIWETRNPLYRNLRNIYKVISRDTNRANDTAKTRSILKELERGNIYIAYDHLLKVFKPSDVIISINPLDKLLSAGGKDSNSITRFETCWANYMNKTQDGVLEFKPKGDYSNPKAQVKLGEHVLSGMVFVDNGKKVECNDVSFHGMKYRSHIWLNIEEQYVYLENIYPEKGSVVLREAMSNILNNTINVKTPNTSTPLQMPDFFDNEKWALEYKSVKALGNSPYLDKCRICDDSGMIKIY